MEALIFDHLGKGYVGAYVETLFKDDFNCIQINMAWAVGNSEYSRGRRLPSGDDEPRKAVCLRTSGFVALTTCSSHLTTEDDNVLNQSFDFLVFTNRTGDDDYATWAGGDFNAEPGTQAIGIWQDGYDQGDARNRATVGNAKLDYSFEQVPVLQNGIAGLFPSQYSDHALIVATFD